MVNLAADGFTCSTAEQAGAAGALPGRTDSSAVLRGCQLLARLQEASTAGARRSSPAPTTPQPVRLGTAAEPGWCMCGCLSAADSATQACKSGLLCKRWAEAACGCLAEPTTVPSPRRRKPSFDEERLAPGQCSSALASPAAQHASCCLPASAAGTEQQVRPSGVPRAAAAPAAFWPPPLAAGAAGASRSPSVSHPGRSAWSAGPPELATQGAASCEVVSICCRFGTYDTFVLAAFSFATSTAEFAARTGIAAGDARRRQPMVRFCLCQRTHGDRNAPYMRPVSEPWPLSAWGNWRPCFSGLPSLQRLGHPPTRVRRTRCLACFRSPRGTRRMTSSCWSLA